MRSTANVAGGWAGGLAGATLGAKAGAAIGLCLGGVGTVPTTIIFGAVGGILGTIGGSWLGTQMTDVIYEF